LGGITYVQTAQKNDAVPQNGELAYKYQKMIFNIIIILTGILLCALIVKKLKT